MAAAAEEGAELIVRPRLALVSTGIRRDLIAPLRYFTKFEIVHFYRRAD